MKELLTEAEEGLRDPDSQKLGAVTSPGWVEGAKGGSPALEAVRAADMTVNLGAVVMVRRRLTVTAREVAQDRKRAGQRHADPLSSGFQPGPPWLTQGQEVG